MIFHGQLPGGSSRNGMPAGKSYQWRGSIHEAIDGPDPEWYRELADNQPAPVIPLRPAPAAVYGRRRFWRGPLPPSLAARLATPPASAVPAGGRRCRRCGYVLARCACPPKRKGGA